MLAYVVSNGSSERAIPFEGNHWSSCFAALCFGVDSQYRYTSLTLFSSSFNKKVSVLNMSFLDKMKAAGKNVVDAGAKTMLKVSGGVKTTQRLVTQRLCLNLDVQ